MVTYRSILSIILALILATLPASSWATAQEEAAAPTVAFRQGNDSNCDFIAVANGIHNIQNGFMVNQS